MKNFLIALFLGLFTVSVQAAVNSQISNMGDTTHLEFSGLEQWDYDIKKSEVKGLTLVVLTVPALSAEAIHELKSFRSTDIKSVSVDPQGPDHKSVVTLTVNAKGIETFDYLTDQPSRLVIDVFKSKAASKDTQASTSVSEENAKTNAKTKVQATNKQKSSPQRAPANDVLIVNPQGAQQTAAETSTEKKSGIFDGADPNFDRFSISDYEIKEEAIIASQENVYLDFPALRMQTPLLDHINSKRPIYEIIPKETDENKQARLLLTLFKNKRYNVFSRTVEWFLQKYPKSEYDEIVRFMWADSLFNLWLDKRVVSDFDLAMIRYRQVLEKYPNSPLVERTLLLMGYATLDRGDYLGTLRLFQSHLRNRPQSANRDLARLAVAEAYLKLNRFDEAEQQYREIEKDASGEKAKMDAAYLVGDVLFQKKDYAKAVSEYQSALKKFPQGASEYPSAFYNQASSLFGQKNYRQSLETYKDFLRRFPSHDYAGYAMTRVGELLEILGADKNRVMGAYLETYFRYGDSPSSVVARLRMLSSRMKGMKEKEVEKAVKDIDELAKKSELPNIEQFATLMVAEGYAKRQDYEKAMDLLVKYYQNHPISADTALLSRRIVSNINEKINEEVNQGDFISALKTHNKYVGTWLKSSPRIDTKYNIARAFDQAGVPAEADTLYRDTLNKIYSLKGTLAEKERNIIEKLPSEDEINLRLASTSFRQGKFNVAYDYLKNIKKPEALKEVDQIERVQLAASLLDKKGDADSAIRYLVELIKTWKGQPQLVASPYFRLAEIELKQGKTDDAMNSLKKIDELMDDSGKVVPELHALALEKLGELQLEKGLGDQALGTYKKLLTVYEPKKPMPSIRYKAGKIYFSKGEIQKAAEFWKELKGQQNDFWYKLAQEQLKNSEWQGDYKKYIKRIPAMEKDTK